MSPMVLTGDAAAFNTWAADWRPQIEARLAAGLTEYASHLVAQQSPLLKAMQHGVMNGGKRVRALAVIAAGQMLHADKKTLLDVAAALEYMHAYSLIHDDLPCMDDDDLRRGQPTVHVLYGEAMALLAGDALQTLAFWTLSVSATDASTQVALIREFARASGVAGMAGGQAIDCHSVGLKLTQTDMQAMHRLKTGALLHASLAMGARCGEGGVAEDIDALNRYAEQLGLLFQVVDDVLDASQSTATLGKTAGKDSQADKPTYVSTLGLDGAQRYALSLYHDCLNSLAPYGARAQRLADLAAYCFERVN